LIRRRNDAFVEDNKKIVEQNRATNQIIDGLQSRFDALENSNKVTDLESIEKIFTAGP
jgi:hypothetical protein